MEIVNGIDYIEEVKFLIREYTKRLNRDLTFQNLDEELKDPKKKYTAPEGELLVALNEEQQVIGMVAYHKHSSTRCEMKRLYITPLGRGQKIGEKLIAAIIEKARLAGYEEMVLDTIKPLETAIHLYHKCGFTECDPYYNNPMSDVIYMSKKL